MTVIPNISVPITLEQALGLNSLVLSFVGDGVHTLYVRTRLATSTDAKAGSLHKSATLEINATAQATKMHTLVNILTEEELDVYKRARNSKVHSPAKNAKIIDYKISSGFEALIGFLYLLGRQDRLQLLLEYEFNKEEALC